jgi:hypothetical protein
MGRWLEPVSNFYPRRGLLVMEKIYWGKKTQKLRTKALRFFLSWCMLFVYSKQKEQTKMKGTNKQAQGVSKKSAKIIYGGGGGDTIGRNACGRNAFGSGSKRGCVPA